MWGDMDALDVNSFPDDVEYEYIDEPEGVTQLCTLLQELEPQECIGLDTEFMRVTCYYPQFALMQLAIRQVNYLVDVWMLEGEVQPIIEALCHTKAKVLAFASSEDIELLAHEARRINCDRTLPEHFYDLQLMLAFCGHSYGRGLNFALQEFLGVNLAKSCTLSNWLARPLSNDQLIYSALDVEYLEPLYHKLEALITPTNMRYFCAEMDYIVHSYDIEPNPEEAYLSIPAAGMLNDKELNTLYYLARDRMLQAQLDNEALNRVITTKAMWKLARYLPRSKRELEHQGVKSGTVRVYGDKILAWLNAARVAPRYDGLTMPLDYYSHQSEMKENFNQLRHTVSTRMASSGIRSEILLKKQLFNDYFRAKALGETPLLQQSWRLELLGQIDVPLEPIVHESSDLTGVTVPAYLQAQ